jgi:Leucine-rich repeat (LRR) protein
MKRNFFCLIAFLYFIVSMCFTSCNQCFKSTKQSRNIPGSDFIDSTTIKKIKVNHAACIYIDSAILYPEEVEYLVIPGNKQYERLPIEVKGLKNLVDLSIQDLYHLNWRNTFRKLTSLKSLQTLEIIDCDIRRLPDNISRLNGLKKLRIQNSNESEAIVFSLAITKLTSLEELFITCTKSKEVPKKIKYLTRLKTIGIGPGLDRFPNELLSLNNIEEIYLDYNNITEVPDEIVKLKKLKVLSIKNTPLAEEETEYLKRHMKYNKLEYIKENMPNLDIQLFYSGPEI